MPAAAAAPLCDPAIMDISNRPRYVRFRATRPRVGRATGSRTGGTPVTGACAARKRRPLPIHCQKPDRNGAGLRHEPPTDVCQSGGAYAHRVLARGYGEAAVHLLGACRRPRSHAGLLGPPVRGTLLPRGGISPGDQGRPDEVDGRILGSDAGRERTPGWACRDGSGTSRTGAWRRKPSASARSTIALCSRIRRSPCGRRTFPASSSFWTS